METWNKFLDVIRDKYRFCGVYKETETKITFKVGEHPTLIKNGLNFRSFRSKISGGCRDAEYYIEHLSAIAESFFPNRIFKWCDSEINIIMYDWDEVHNPTNKYINGNNFNYDKFCGSDDHELVNLKLKYFLYLNQFQDKNY